MMLRVRLWLQAAFAEYNALRAEVLQCLGDAERIVQLGLTGVVAAAAFGFVSQDARAAAFVLLIPIIGAYVAITWCRITIHIAGLGSHLHGLEERINRACHCQELDDPMSWETRRTGRQPGQQAQGTVERTTFKVITAVPLASAVYGNLVLFENGHPELGALGVIFDLVLLGVVGIAYIKGFEAARSTLIR
jgi:hypothetical protein